MGGSYRFLKVALDFVFGIIALAFLAPLMLAISLAILADTGRPILFRQARAGRDGSAFELLKFRSMRDDSANTPTTDPKSLETKVGNFLRRTSLDELPQLINVLRGEMSLVGPRPLLMEYTSLYNDRQKSRLKVKPGITGLAQVKGRNLLTWHQRLELDAVYVDEISLCKDIQIVIQTFPVVTSGRGVSNKAGHHMPPFDGTGE